MIIMVISAPAIQATSISGPDRIWLREIGMSGAIVLSVLDSATVRASGTS